MTSPHYAIDFKSLSTLLAQQAERVAVHLYPNGKKNGNDWCVGDASGSDSRKGIGSFRICLTGDKAGLCRDFANDEKGFDLLDAWSKRLNIGKLEAAKQAQKFLKVSVPVTTNDVTNKPIRSTNNDQPYNKEWNDKLVKRLNKNSNAINYLNNRGISLITQARFCLGLSAPYTNRKTGDTQENALVFPVKDENGNFIRRYGYYNIPGLTQNPLDKNGWMKGSPSCYYADKYTGQSIIFVCEGIKDVWRHWQALSECSLSDGILVVSSTHGSSIPEEWRFSNYWRRFEKVYLGQDNDSVGESLVNSMCEYMGRESYRASVPDTLGKDWTNFWNNGGTKELFQNILSNAPLVSSFVEDEDGVGLHSYDPIDVNGAYHNGHLYYVTKVINRQKEIVTEDEADKVINTARKETIIIRSDKTKLRVLIEKAPKGTPLEDRILMLSDGTIIAKQPIPNDAATWKWPDIKRYLNGEARVRPLNTILNDILDVLKRAVWLPYPEDYATLALTVVVTYVQSAFESVPLLLLCGPAASGKSQTGYIMSKLCCNGSTIGQVSAAAIARHIDQTRGFVVLDDLEGISNKTRDNSFNELVQALKVSYNKNTATKTWVDVKTMKTETLNFFGVKMVNNTSGTDSILGTRMIRIQTRQMPTSVAKGFQDFGVSVFNKMEKLRSELHTWAFENVIEVDKLYKKKYSKKSNREEEIAAPLRVIVKLAGNESLSENLEKTLTRRSQQTDESMLPEEVLKESVRELIKEGYREVAVKHIALKMLYSLDPNYGKSSTNEIPEWSNQVWIGKKLRAEALVKPDNKIRKVRLTGKKGQYRIATISDYLVAEVKQESVERGHPIETDIKQPTHFCDSCSMCQYSDVCDIEVK